MQPSFFYELIGYAGSVLVAVSLMMKSLVRLRMINLVGALFFVIYGLLIGAFPVAFLNTLIVVVNVYYLTRMWKQKDYFKLLEVSHDSRYLKNFVDFYQKEISEFFPSYLFKPQPDQLTVFVLRNMVPAGLLIVKPQAQMEQAEIFLDFVIPNYRDFRAGKFLFEESAAYFQQKGIKRFVSQAGSPRHEAYLKRMGFQLQDGIYSFTLRV
ncbi:MAG: YgjV family protein [Anaerolineales bacterium]|nr:YgjV family protein [Anaerolineales bacterium]